ncbi:MAG: hypothetical protein ACYCVD_19950 [Desulfitobacteriaceae bacterium]
MMLTGPGLGVMGDELAENTTKVIPIRDDKAIFAESVELPLNPMFGQ